MKGIGRALVKQLVSLNAHVIAVSQNESKLRSLKEEFEGIETVSVDLSNWNEAKDRLAKYCEKVDFLVNNAGCSYVCPIDQVEEGELNKIIDTNLKAPMNLIRLVAKGMKERRFGSIVNVSSVAGIVALDDHVVYAASKAGLDMVTKVCAKELGPYNIRVNSVNPTVVWTEMGSERWSDPVKKSEMLSKIPIGRFVEVKEVVEPIVFLLSQRSSMVSGITLPIDGGFVAS